MKAVRLADIADVTMGTAPPGSSYNDTGEGFPLIAGAGDFGVTHPAPKKWSTQPSRISEPGDLLVCVRATIGDLNWADRQYCLGRGVAGVRVNDNLATSGYVACFLDANKHQLAKLGTGSTFPAIRRADLEDFLIPLPPLPVQKRIAAILDAADALRAKRRESIEQLDSLIQATFLEMFGDPVTNPKNWEPSTLGAICDIQTGYAWKSKQFNSDGIGTPVIRIQNVGTSEAELIHTEEPPISRFWVTPSELLLTLSGSFRLAKWSGPKALLNQRIARLTVKPGANKSFIEHALATRLNAIEAMGRHSLVNNVALADLREMGMYLPPLALQARFASIVESIEQQKARLKAHLAELDTLFASLQSRAFNGELVA